MRSILLLSSVLIISHQLDEVYSFVHPSFPTSLHYHYNSLAKKNGASARGKYFSSPLNDKKRNKVILDVTSLDNQDRTTIVEEVTPDDQTILKDDNQGGGEEGTRLKQIKTFISDKIGTVDEERLAFPEIVSGEVPRMFSNISYQKLNDDSGVEGQSLVQAIHASGSVVGATALIAGTTIGAGILALPTATAPAGFLPSSFALSVAWMYMAISGLLIAELSINRMGETGKQGVGLLEIYKSYLGDGLGILGSGAYFFLHYAIMCAYVSAGGDNLGSFMVNVLGMGSSITSIHGLDQILFALSTGGLVYFANPKFMEKFNNVLVLGVIGSFLGVVGLGVGSADFGALVSLENQHPVRF